MKYARVYILDAPTAIDRPFDYSLPESLSDIRRGCFVSVPFGRANKKKTALIFDVCDSTDSKNTKQVLSGEHEKYALSESALELCDFIKEYTLCTTGDAVHTILPAGVFSKDGGKSVGEKYVLQARRKITEAQLLDFLNGCGVKKLRGAKQILLAKSLTENFVPAAELFEKCECTNAQLRALVNCGIAETKRVQEYRNPYAELKIDESRKNILSDSQARAFDKIAAEYDTHTARAVLLFGVTGSGKTRVMKSVIDRVVADGRGVIILVPEISLTPQTVGLFCSFYGQRVAVLHSSLSAGERLDAYDRIKRGDVDIVIGTRSAVFAPLKNLGMIIIDEEQEHTYKSDQNPKYHARDIARFRCKQSGALMLLASATPSVESFYKAMNGTYTLIELSERYGGAHLPRVCISDMRNETQSGNTSPLGELLTSSLAEVASEKNQAILFLNRRGYNNYMSCKACGNVITCPRCSVSLTHHKTHGNSILLCHFCGYAAPVPSVCPECGNTHPTFTGFGTQKVEDEIKTLFPSMRVMRMDADTTSTKNSYDELLGGFKKKQADVLLGTQMVTKGHDFPDVTLVGVVLADTALYLSDFRANERTFSLLTQVIGRAGRGAKAGVAIIQTYNPKNEILRLACAQDYKEFYKKDIALRRALTFPPFCDIAQITVTGADEVAVSSRAVQLAKKLRTLRDGEYKDIPLVIFGPFEAPVYKVQEKYRMRMIIKCRQSRRMRQMFADVMKEFSVGGKDKTTLSIDINPTNI